MDVKQASTLTIGVIESQDTGRRISALRNSWPGLLALLAAAPLAGVIGFIYKSMHDTPEKAVMAVGAALALVVSAPSVAYLLRRRRAASPSALALIVLAPICIALVSIYLSWVSYQVQFPADILTWSESDFVNDILKFRAGYPLYTAQVNNESFTYVPGPQLLTYLIARLVGQATSIPAYRAIQLGYTLIATLLAYLCVWWLTTMTTPRDQPRPGKIWPVLWLPILGLAATNSVTNPFIHNLHGDALAQLTTVLAFFLLLLYMSTKQRWVLALMVAVPALGFLVKQNQILWLPLYALYLAIFDRPRNWRRVLLFTAASGVALVATVGICYLIWGEPFIYWAFIVLGSHGVSPLRAFQHILDVWPYYVIGLVAGLVILRNRPHHRAFDALLGAWLVWLVLILVETYSSGIAWMLNHIGPGSLIAAIWFCAALPQLHLVVLPPQPASERNLFSLEAWWRVAAGLGVALLLFNGLGFFRIPMPSLSSDAYRYIGEIEREFEGQKKDAVLLDMGTWLYLPDGIIMEDRSPSIGERGYSETGDFSGILQRIDAQRYDKILVRDLHSPNFQYDYWLWRKPSGIRAALIDNYEEIRVIRGLEMPDPNQLPSIGFTDISVLVPRSP